MSTWMVNPDPNLIFGLERWIEGRNIELAVMEGLFPEIFETQGITRGAVQQGNSVRD